jgi:hypothetical protein
MSDDEIKIPDNLCSLGRKAHDVIVTYLRELGRTNTGGCQAFYSPAAWQQRGEEYGVRSVLVVVYDGGELRPVFSLDAAYEHDCRTFRERGDEYVPYEMHEAMQKRLHDVGLYVEECTGWYAAVYPVMP